MADIYDPLSRIAQTPEAARPAITDYVRPEDWERLNPTTRMWIQNIDRIVEERFPEFVAQERLGDLSASQSRQLKTSIVSALLRGDVHPNKEVDAKVADSFLDFMQSRTAMNDPSMTYSEYAQSPNKQYALSQGGAANLEAAREYNLLRGMKTSGRHMAPGWNEWVATDWAFAMLGSLVDPDMGRLAQWRDPRKDPKRKPGADPVAFMDNRAREAMFWYWQGNQHDPQNPVWSEGSLNAKTPDDSFSTWAGVANTLSRTDNPIGYYGTAVENFRTGPFQRTAHAVGKMAYDIVYPDGRRAEQYVPMAYDLINSFADLPAQQHIAHLTQRKTPLKPDNPQQQQVLDSAAKDYLQSADWSQKSAHAYSPQFFEAIGQPRRYFSPLEDAAVTALSSVVADPTTLLSGGLSAAGKVAKTSTVLPSLAKGFGTAVSPFDLAEEMAFTAIPMAEGMSQAPKLDPNQFSDQVYLDTSLGPSYVEADSPQYDTAYSEAVRRERDRRYRMRQASGLLGENPLWK